MNTRKRVYDILESIEEGSRWVPVRGGDRDDAFVRTIVQGVMRWRLTIDHLIGRLSGREISRIDPPLLRLLRIGIYQLHWMRVPDHAAVNESVELAKRLAPRGRGFVNAILRKATRTNLDELLPRGSDLTSVAIRTSHPAWILERWRETFGAERMLRIAEANQEPSNPDLFVDTRYVTPSEVIEQLAGDGVESVESSLVPGMVRVFGSTSTLSEMIERGHVWPMDEGSAIIAMLAGEGSSVLDLAAAPGGKSLAMLARNNRVVSHDVSIERLGPLVRLRRHESRIRIVVGDGSMPPFRSRFPVVLLDAPCSASGIIRKHPEIRWRLSEDLIRQSAAVQAALLDRAMSLTEDRLVHATCSLEREENDAVIRDALDRTNEFEMDDARSYLPDHLHEHVSRGILRLGPDSGTDGFTAIVIKRRDPGHSNRL